MPVPLIVLGKTVMASTKAQAALSPKDAFMGNNKELVIMFMAGAAILVFIQHTRSGTPLDGRQYVAIGIVGFVLLFLADLAPEIAFAFALLFLISIALNSPNGVPVVATKKGK